MSKCEHVWVQVVDGMCADCVRKRIADLEQQLDAVKGKTYCAYCGYAVPFDNTDVADAISKHIVACEKHPMQALASKVNQLEAENIRLRERVVELKKVLETAEATLCCTTDDFLQPSNRLMARIAAVLKED